jgi:hypothetical protein
MIVNNQVGLGLRVGPMIQDGHCLLTIGLIVKGWR